MTEKMLTLKDFADKLGQDFSLSAPGLAPVTLNLTEAEAVEMRRAPPDARAPFSLVFLAREQRVLPQNIYRIEHAGLGAVDIFLVPIGRDAKGVSYQATFN
jgi:hypothetical protein